MPSCWFNSAFAGQPQNNHPLLPDEVPPANQLLQDNHDHFAVKQCPHCNKIWQRDVNACRYTIIFNPGILVSYIIFFVKTLGLMSMGCLKTGR